MQEDVLVMDVECACDVLWIMYAFCVMLNACVLSHVLYMSFACLLSKESDKQKKTANFPALSTANTGQRSLCRVPGVWHSAKLKKKCCKNSHFPSFVECHSLALSKEVNFAECHSLALGKEVNFAECQMVQLGKDYS